MRSNGDDQLYGISNMRRQFREITAATGCWCVLALGLFTVLSALNDVFAKDAIANVTSGVGLSRSADDQRGFGGPYAPWNIPANNLPTAANSDELVDKLYEYTSGKFNLNSRRWSISLRHAGDATGLYEVVTSRPKWGNMHGKKMPWDPNWQFADDSDAYVVLYDSRNGHAWEIWGSPEFKNNKIYAGAAKLVQEGIDLWPSNQPADIRVKENGFKPSGASGLPRAFMMITRDEIQQGYIPHALTYSFPNPALYDYVGPAIKGAGPLTAGEPDRLGMGVRFVWDLTDEDIDHWARTLDPNVRRGMRAIAMALRDYGAIGVDNGGNRKKNIGVIGNLEHDLTANWDEIGFSKKGTFRALYSLLSQNKHKARAIKPCSFDGGNLDKTCCYPKSAVSYPKGHQCRP